MHNDERRGLDMAVPYKACPVDTRHYINDGIYIRSYNDGKMPLVKEENMTLHKEIHHKCIGISLIMCEECKAAIGEGFYLIEYDLTKSSEQDIKDGNPYRTGRVSGFIKDAWERYFPGNPYPPHQWMYVYEPILKDLIGENKKLQAT